DLDQRRDEASRKGVVELLDPDGKSLGLVVGIADRAKAAATCELLVHEERRLATLVRQGRTAHVDTRKSRRETVGQPRYRFKSNVPALRCNLRESCEEPAFVSPDIDAARVASQHCRRKQP